MIISKKKYDELYRLLSEKDEQISALRSELEDEKTTRELFSQALDGFRERDADLKEALDKCKSDFYACREDLYKLRDRHAVVMKRMVKACIADTIASGKPDEEFMKWITE